MHRLREDIQQEKHEWLSQSSQEPWGNSVLRAVWRLRTHEVQTPHVKPTDFVFPSIRTRGKKPLCASTFVADYLRPAAKAAGVQIEDGQRFGLHNLRHSLSNWLVNKAKVEPKTVQGIMRHSRIQTTLDLYTQEDSDETRAAQGEFLTAVGMTAMVQ
jgi:integrase